MTSQTPVALGPAPTAAPRIWWRILAEEALDALPLAGCFHGETAPPALLDLLVPEEAPPPLLDMVAPADARWGDHGALVEAWFASGEAAAFTEDVE